MNIATRTEVNFNARDKRAIFATWALITDLVDAIPDGKEVLEINPETAEIVEEMTKDELRQVRETLLKLVRIDHDKLVTEIW